MYLDNYQYDWKIVNKSLKLRKVKEARLISWLKFPGSILCLGVVLGISPLSDQRELANLTENCVIEVACSQTLYFLFEVRPMLLIKLKNRGGFLDRQRKGIGVEEEETHLFSRTRRCFRKERKEK